MKKTYKGLTLVELIVVIALIGVVITVASSIMLFGQKTANLSEETAMKQFDVRQPIKGFSNQIRYASDLEILDSDPLSYEGGYSYIIYDDATKTIKYIEDSVEMAITGLTTISDLTFSVSKNNVNLKQISFTFGKVDTTQYDLTTSLIINNLSDTGVIGVSSGIGVKYK